jgi:hypothetical protein
MQTLPLSRADIVVQSASGDLLAIVEIKNSVNLSPEYASIIRKNLIDDSRFNRAARYFLVLSQDIGYLWDQDENPTAEASLPAVTFPMRQVVEQYLPTLIGEGRLNHLEVELAVLQWLWDLTRDDTRRPHEPDIALSKTAFLDLIRGGRINAEIDN